MEVTVLDRQRSRRIDRRRVARFLRRVAAEAGPSPDGGMAVCLVGARRMREYNRRFRGRDTSTDVLSFPAGDEGSSPAGAWLGDIVISVPDAARQARQAGHSLVREIEVLALHGYLHLLGFDHETDGGTMLRLERRLVRRLHAGG